MIINKPDLNRPASYKTLYTAKSSALLELDLKPRQSFTEKSRSQDVLLRVTAGEGKISLNGLTHDISSDSLLLVPAGTGLKIINTSPHNHIKIYAVAMNS